MILKIKKRDLMVVLPVLALFAAVIIILSSNSRIVIGACTETDTYTLIAHDPSRINIGNDTEVIDPEASDGAGNCDTATTNTARLSVSCQKAGNYTANVTCVDCTGTFHAHSSTSNTTVLTCYAPENQKFLIRNTSSEVIAAFDEKGYVYLRGDNVTGLSSMSPTPSSYIIKDKSGAVVAYINRTGYLFLKGKIFMSQSAVSPAPSSFIIRNSTGRDVSYINSSGDLVLSGKIYHNWTDSI